MTDDTPKKRPSRSRSSSSDASRRDPPAGDAGQPLSSEDPDAALQRLESMGASGSAKSAPVASATAAPTTRGGAPSDRARPMGSATGTPRSRPRPAAAPSSSRVVVRIAAPVVFLIAIIALIGIVVQSGVIGGAGEPTPTPTPKVTKTKGGSATQPGTKKYIVKSGDSLSGIADKFNTSVSELQTLNPKLDTTTLSVGVKIVVPTQ